jgi:hypothetical protein
MEANLFVERSLKGCEIAATTGGFFILEHPEDLGTVQGEQPGSIWQWEELLDLIPKLAAICFAIQQCHFGGLTPKPTRFLVNMKVDDPRCYISLPLFDKAGYYKGPLPKDCGHVHSHKLIGKTASRWNTAPSASYPSQLCEFLANLIINATASCGGGPENEIPAQPEVKKRRLSNNMPAQVETRDVGLTCKVAGSSGSGSTGNVDFGCSTVDATTLGKAHASSSTADKTASRESNPKVWTVGEHIVVSDSEGEQVTVGSQACGSADLQFDMSACLNTGRPIQVEWDRTQRGFVDGFGLCSPCRWKPHQRGTGRTHDMIKLADDTFNLLVEGVRESVGDLRMEAFKLVTGKLTQSPFTSTALQKVRSKWFSLLKDPNDAAVLDEGQPFFLRALSQWLTCFEDPDAHWLTGVEDSFSTGVCLGVQKPLPRSRQVFPEKQKHRKLDETEFMPIAENYSSAQISAKELEDKFKEEEMLGRMHPSKLGVLQKEYGSSLRIASMAAIAKPDGTVRPLHDATHSVMVNHDIVYQDKIDCPGPPEIAAIVREATSTKEAPFCVSADIKAAHRLVKVRKVDWGYTCCRADSNSDTVWVNHTGTFGVSSAPYWWAKLAGLLGRFVGFLFHQRWMMQMIYVDDLHGVFIGPEKFLFLWVWVLAYELIGTPFGYHKFKGGYASEFVGFQIRYDLAEVGVSTKRGEWLLSWITNARANKFVVPARDFAEFLGRLGFISQLVTWLKPHLAPLFAWSAVTAKGTVGRLPETIILTLDYIEKEMKEESFLVSTKRPTVLAGERFRTDAKCAQGYIVLAGWDMQTRKWFALRLGPTEVPYFFKSDGSSQWASTAAELMASLVALHVFGWLAPNRDRKTLDLALTAGTDNQSNEALSSKRSTTKWPLMAVNMQLSSSLARARLSLSLKWRPREQNVEADQLTNENFEGFPEEDRLVISFHELDLKVLDGLVRTRAEFVTARDREKEAAKTVGGTKKKRFDKTPW